VNHRPYPDPDRALRQLARKERVTHDVRALPDGSIAEEHTFPGQSLAALTSAVRRTGRTAITEAALDKARRAGEHVHSTGTLGPLCWNGGNCGTWRGDWPGPHRNLIMVVLDGATDSPATEARVTCDCGLDTGTITPERANELQSEHYAIAVRQAGQR
jgi:hypothetical protein